MSWKTRKLTRAELSIAFSEAWIAARLLCNETKIVKQGSKKIAVLKFPGLKLRDAFAGQLKQKLRAMRESLKVWVGPAPKVDPAFEIMRIEAADRLTNADRARLSELKSLPLAA